MSRVNKVNPSQYKLGGRLTPDDAARERVKQGQAAAPVAKTPQAGPDAMPTRAPGSREKGAAQAPARAEAKARTRSAGRSRG